MRRMAAMMRTSMMMGALMILMMGTLMTGTGVAQMAGQTDEAVIRKMVSDQAEAWNRGDGAGWASGFTDDADFINVRGDVFHGRGEIAARHAGILAGPYKGSHAVVTVRRFAMLSPDVALVETVHEVRDFSGLPPGIAATEPGLLRTHMKYVVVKRGGEWRFVAAQNTAQLAKAGGPPV